QRHLALLSAPITFHAGGRTSKNGDGFFEPGTLERHFSRVVAWAVFLLKAWFVFFVDYDQPQVRKWREDRRTCPQEDTDGSIPDPGPHPPTLPRRDPAVPDSHDVMAKPSFKPFGKKRRERNFWQKIQRLPTAF